MTNNSRNRWRKPFLNGEPDWASAFWVSIERLKRTQLRPGSTYHRQRPFVPAVAMALVWTLVTEWMDPFTLHKYLGYSITIRHLWLALGIVCIWNAWVSLSGFHPRRQGGEINAEIRRIIGASVACGFFLLASNLIRAESGKGLFLGTLLSASLLITGGTWLFFTYLVAARLLPRISKSRNVLVVGTGPRAKRLRSRLRFFGEHYEIYGCIDDQYLGANKDKDKYLGPLSRLEELLKEQPIEVVVIGLPIRSKYDEIQSVIRSCEKIGVESHHMTDIFDTEIASHQQHSEEPSHFTVLGAMRHARLQQVKWLLDFVGATVLLVLASPIMLIAAIAIRLSSPGPVLFVQQRYGRNRQRFAMFKFRTMVVDAEARQTELETLNEAQGPVFKINRDPRVTRVGSFLRRTSIDELPQLFNVLRGEMSLVGPRPLPLRDVLRFQEPWLLRRFSVKPGLTCLWQVGGRSNTTFDEWIRQDLEYIDAWSLSLDMRILLKTVPAVIKGSGAM